ncbi:MAG: hypothetical protein ACREQN_10795, partial [Candidatus Binataceae bacterium]
MPIRNRRAAAAMLRSVEGMRPANTAPEGVGEGSDAERGATLPDVAPAAPMAMPPTAIEAAASGINNTHDGEVAVVADVAVRETGASA